ncbi:MAG: hypothetical protein PHF46_02890 [Candidatus Gracilibacteria bacterium]|nr:hypothetical protein [Candidatus Gracilibacteria bacterium]MDD3120330.1 hypothetical protein [Candidatus Gracilibacteria bacterium]MDD4530608.1 hypothetical protein [Candidatus Gracilibacteria bacterium]
MDLSKLFGSKCRVKILERMVVENVLNEGSGFFMRELSRDINEQINAVRRELLNLEDLGILATRENNKKKFYYLNHLFPLFSELREIFMKNYNCIEVIRIFFNANKSKVSLVVTSDNLRELNKNSSGNIVDLFIIGEIDKQDLGAFLTKNFFGKKVKYAIITKKDFEERLKYKDKLVTSILKQKGNIFLIDEFDMQNNLEQFS